MRDPNLYNAEVSAGSLMLPESRRIAAFMLTDPDQAAWRRAFSLEENLLQKNKPATARRIARLIRNRFAGARQETLRLVAEGTREVALQILFACAVKHSRLLGDYLNDVYRERLRRLERTLDAKSWGDFLVTESVFTGSAGLKAVALANFPPLATGQTPAVWRRHREKTAAEAHYSGL